MASSYPHPDPSLPPSGGHEPARDWRCRQARAQAFEEAVSLALFASAWMEHSRKDVRASRGAHLIAKLLASCSGQPPLRGPDGFAAARRFLEEEHE